MRRASGRSRRAAEAPRPPAPPESPEAAAVGSSRRKEQRPGQTGVPLANAAVIPLPLPVPLLLPCPLTAARIAGLRATVVLLLILLFKSKLLRVKMSLLGSLLGLLLTLAFLASSGALVLLAGGATAFAMQQRRNATA